MAPLTLDLFNTCSTLGTRLTCKRNPGVGQSSCWHACDALARGKQAVQLLLLQLLLLLVLLLPRLLLLVLLLLVLLALLCKAPGIAGVPPQKLLRKPSVVCCADGIRGGWGHDWRTVGHVSCALYCAPCCRRAVLVLQWPWVPRGWLLHTGRGAGVAVLVRGRRYCTTWQRACDARQACCWPDLRLRFWRRPRDVATAASQWRLLCVVTGQQCHESSRAHVGWLIMHLHGHGSSACSSSASQFGGHCGACSSLLVLHGTLRWLCIHCALAGSWGASLPPGPKCCLHRSWVGAVQRLQRLQRVQG